MKKLRKSGFKIALMGFALLICFALCLNLFFFFAVSRAGEDQADDFAAALNYIFQPVSEMLDGHYLSEIDAPMEALLSSAPYVSYSFTTKQYPANNELIARLESELDKLCRNSTAITGALIYSPTNDSYIASSTLTTEGSPLADGQTGIRTLLFNYNTGSLRKSQIASTEHLTFIFQDQDCFIVSKDLTTLSGQVYSTLYLMLDIDDFAAYLFEGNVLNDHYHDHIDVGIFDDGGNALYTSATLDPTVAREVLFRTAGRADVLPLDDAYGVSFRSSVLNWQYVFVVDRSFLSPLSEPESKWRLFAIGMLASVLLAAAFLWVICLLFKPMRASFAALTRKLAIDENLPLMKRPNALDAISEKVSLRLTEAEELKSVLSHVSDEAVSMLFFRMLSGVHYEPHALEAAMQHTDYGFTIDDVYVAGVAVHGDGLQLNLETRQEVNDFLTGQLNKLGGKYPCNHIALTLDMPMFAIVLSFPSGTPIAKCKYMLNELSKQLAGAIQAKGYPIELRFGHLYHSIYDLSFSFHEAMKLAQAEATVSRDEPAAPAPEAIEAAEAEPAPQPVAEEPYAGVDYAGLIDRRAAQITNLVLEGKRDEVPQVLDRTLRTILTKADAAHRAEHAQRLISAVTEAMITNRFVVHEHLTDVSGKLGEQIRQGVSDEQLAELTRQGVYTLCEDLDRILEKQRNPYIGAALQYIDAHYSDPALTLEQIAENLGIAPNYLSSLFSKCLGKKLFEYVNEVRLERAIDMLVNSRATINEICERSGFGSPRNFMRQFKKYTDMTPTAYRKQRQGGGEANETEE